MNRYLALLTFVDGTSVVNLVKARSVDDVNQLVREPYYFGNMPVYVGVRKLTDLFECTMQDNETLQLFLINT